MEWRAATGGQAKGCVLERGEFSRSTRGALGLHFSLGSWRLRDGENHLNEDCGNII